LPTVITIELLFQHQYFISGVSMSLRRVGQLVATMAVTLIGLSCGQVYRPVVIPCSAGQIPGCPTETLPNPDNFHEVFALSTNVPFFPGTAMQIDVSGDSVIAATSNDPSGSNMLNPTHGAILPNNSRIFVASAGSLTAGMSDVITSFSPASDSTTATGFGTVSTFNLPNLGPSDPTTGQPEWSCSYLPDFVATSQNNAVYVANYGVDNASSCAPNLASTDSIASLNLVQNTIGDLTYLPAGSHPVAMAETPDGQNLYVVNQGSNNVMDLSPTYLSTITTLAVPNTPVWATLRVDGQRLYVITQGDGKLYTIRTDTNAFVGTALSVGGAGANYAIYDSNLNRLYVINPNVAAVFVFDATTDPPTALGSAAGISIPPPPVTGVGPVIPVSVAALPDGSRFYVASYVVANGACPSSSIAAANCILPQATVFNAASLTYKSTVFPLLTPVTLPDGTVVNRLGVTPVASCVPVTPYVPGNARFRLSAAASLDSTRAYVGICDAGAVAVIDTVTSSNSTGTNDATDTLDLDLNAPLSASGTTVTGEPPPQNPIFFFTGQ
jgi:DNA-binding beta-propeller fold protein YncE